jgi:hypothetical protein
MSFVSMPCATRHAGTKFILVVTPLTPGTHPESNRSQRDQERERFTQKAGAKIVDLRGTRMHPRAAGIVSTWGVPCR